MILANIIIFEPMDESGMLFSNTTVLFYSFFIICKKSDKLHLFFAVILLLKMVKETSFNYIHFSNNFKSKTKTIYKLDYLCY